MTLVQLVQTIDKILEKYPELGNIFEKYPEIHKHIKTARHIEDTDQCMITLPCTNKNKKLLIMTLEV